MGQDPIIFSAQPAELFGLNESADKGSELQSLIWEAAESLASPDLMQRMAALQRLEEYDAIRQLPLVIYLLITRITEPDIELRTRIVKAIGSAGCINPANPPASESVQKTLIYHLSHIRTREIFALLQVAEYDKLAEPFIANLLSCSSFAGGHLAHILSERETPREIRRQAAHFIGMLGFLDALPTLERLASRFAGRSNERETDLLVELQSAVEQLTAP